MIRIKVTSLEEIYNSLAMLSQSFGKLSVFDFVCGELGYEALMTQAIGGEFFKNNHSQTTVVSLCWKGCSRLAVNTSHAQVELDNIKYSIAGNVSHSGNPRHQWLNKNKHRQKVDSLSFVNNHVGPMFWKGGMGGIGGDCQASQTFGEQDMFTIRKMAADYVTWSQFKLLKEENSEPLVEMPYIALFDRNEKHMPRRNTTVEDIEYYSEYAKQNGLGFVVISGLYPREILPDNTIHFCPEHRDIDLMVNIASFCEMFITPPCGIGEVAAITGANIVMIGELNKYEKKQWDIVSRMSTERGFRFTYRGKITGGKITE